MRHFFKLKWFFTKSEKKTFRHLSSSRVVLISAMLPCSHALPPLHSWTSLGSSSDNATRTRGDKLCCIGVYLALCVCEECESFALSFTPKHWCCVCTWSWVLQRRVTSSAPTRFPCPAPGLHISPSITTVVRVCCCGEALDQFWRESFREGVTMTHKPTLLLWLLLLLFLNASMPNRFCFSESSVISAKENTQSSASLAFATLGKNLRLFLP